MNIDLYFVNNGVATLTAEIVTIIINLDDINESY